MIKRISFATRNVALAAETFASAWPLQVAAAAAAPDQVRPARIAVCTPLPDVIADPRYDGVALEWFVDAAHVERYQRWVDSTDGHGPRQQADDVVDRDASRVLVADELVLRGADWLERRWRDGGEKVKHMALAVRANGLTPAEFSARWKDRAGRVRRVGAADVTVIPDDARGLAYVQNHPVAPAVGDRAYDAVNEVYFDDAAGLRTRVEWFHENLREQTEADLVRESWFLAVRERPVHG